MLVHLYIHLSTFVLALAMSTIHFMMFQSVQTKTSVSPIKTDKVEYTTLTCMTLIEAAPALPTLIVTGFTNAERAKF